jgi:thiol-disulfide isomerase/thioredoxin
VTEQGDANLYKIAVNLSAQGMSKTLESYMTKDGKMLLQGVVIDEFKEAVEQQEQQRKEAENRSRVPQQEQQKQTTIGNFIVSEDEICKEEDKPIIYYFGSDGCGYCKWEHPVIVNVTSNFEGYISLHDNMNSDADRGIFSKYSTGGVPTLVFGCKYYRVGAGTGMGIEQESKALTALICDLTGNKPVDVCSDPEIEALVAQLG